VTTALAVLTGFAPGAVHADLLSAPAGSAAPVSYFNWIDHASPGFQMDNVHILNPGSSTATGTVTVPGRWSVNFSVPAGGEWYQGAPYGVIGGPVTVQVTSGPAVIASHRVLYQGNFTEVPAATAADAVSDSWFTWYDRASPGMDNDNIHLLNLGGQQSTGRLIVGSSTVGFSVPAGGEALYNFPFGTIGGPVHVVVDAGPPVIASQRVQYYNSFNEVLAQPTGRAASSLLFNWYDRASPGMDNDNVHVLNPGPGTATGSATMGGSSKAFSLGPGEQTLLGWPGGIGGPVTVTTTAGVVLSSQRLQRSGTFSEWWARSAASASTDSWFNWYDYASAGMVDDIHVANPGSSAATVVMSLPGQAGQQFTVQPGQDVIKDYPKGVIGGPLRIQATSGPGVIASQRAWIIPPPTSRTLNVPYYHQNYSLSCEEASLRMALASRGVNVSEDQILNDIGIDWRPAYWDSAGMHWGDPYANVVGDPNGSELNYTGYGTYHSTIARASHDFGVATVADGENISPGSVYQAILDGHPVVAWVAFDWRYHSPTYYQAFDGRTVQYGYGWEHAVTLAGVTPDSVLVNNPWSGQQWIAKSTFESAFASLHDMAVIVN
jgi:uncharacterized protein YvpB